MSKYFSISFSITIFLIFVYTLFYDTLNVPSFDDYNATLSFIKQFYFDTQSISERFKTLFLRHNEHRILFSKISSAAYYAIFSEINFAHLVIFQNIFLLAFFGLILSLFKREKQLDSTVFLLITAILFSFSFWQVSFYYWAGIQHYTVFFFSFMSLIMLNKTDKILSPDFFLAVLLSGLAVFSFGNGFLVLLTGIFLLFAQKKYSVLSIWTIISCVLIYFTFMVQKDANLRPDSSFNIEWMVRLLLTFLGSFLYINPATGQYVNIAICMVAGFSVLAFWLWLFFSGYAFKNPLLYSLLSLPILTGIIIAISRFETKSAGGIAPRYMFFTATIPIMLLLILLDLKIVKRQNLPHLAMAAVLLWGVSFYNNGKAMSTQNEEILITTKKWEKDNNVRLVYYRDAKEYTEILNWALNYQVVRGNIYNGYVQNANE